ncbi:MAG: sigma-70 family RNA polymerase sigma factor [Clostridia bacterium]|nr:sigma-70 family RNA polymerase sigma factor [Clostridia bacterium]
MTAQPEARQEEELITRVQRGDTSAYEELLLPYAALLHHLARRLRLSFVAEDELVQAGYVGMMRAAERFDARKDVRFSTYAVPWALGEMKSALRRATDGGTRVLSIEAGEEGASLSDILSGGEIDVEALSLRHALMRLSERERELIELRFFRDRTQQEAARELGKSQTQISRMERRTLDRLRELLKD